MGIDGPLQKVLEAWESLDEITKRAIFQIVARCNDSLFKRLSKGMHGFTAKGLIARPAPIARHIDQLLFTLDRGEYACAFFQCFFVVCESDLNDLFLEAFTTAARESPEASSKFAAETALQTLRTEKVDSPFLRLYEAALRCFAPSRFKEAPPDASDLHPRPEAEEVTDVQRNDRESLPPDGSRSGKEPTNNDADEAAHGKTNSNRDVESGKGKREYVFAEDSVIKHNNHAMPDPQRVIERFDAAISEIHVLPVNRLRPILGKLKRTVAEQTEKMAGFEDLKLRFQEALAKLPCTPGIEDLAEKDLSSADALTMEDAMEALQEGIVHVSAIEEARTRVASLSAELGRTCPPLDCVDLKTGLKGLLSGALQLAESMEQEFVRLQDRAALLVELREGIESCDSDSATKLVSEISPSQWLDIMLASLALLSRSNPVPTAFRKENSKAMETAELFFADEILPLVARTMCPGGDKGKKRLLAAVREAFGEDYQRPLRFLLSGFTFQELMQLADSVFSVAQTIAESSILGMVVHANKETAPWLQVLANSHDITPALADFIREVAASAERGQFLMELRQLCNPSEVDDNLKGYLNSAQRELQRQVEARGHGGNYHKLRETARALFFLPTWELVQAGQVAGALRKWQSFGDCDEMVKHCVADVASSHRIEERHLNKTRRHISDFGDALVHLATHCSLAEGETRGALAGALNKLRVVARDSVRPAKDCFVSELEELARDTKGNQHSVPAFFGRIGQTPGHVRIELVDPRETRSWILAVHSDTNEAPVATVLAERLLRSLPGTPAHKEMKSVLKSLLSAGEYDAAFLLVEQCPQLEPDFKEEAERIKKDFRFKNGALFSKASSLSSEDDLVEMCLNEIELLVEELQLTEANVLLLELEDHLDKHEERISPQYLRLVDVIQEAGREIAGDSDLETLQYQIAEIRAAAEDVRLHVTILVEASRDVLLDGQFRESAAELAELIDRPTLWPTEKDSRDLHEDISIIVNHLRSRFRWRQTHPLKHAQLSTAIASFLRTELDPDVCGTYKGAEGSRLTDLATYIEVESWEAEEVLKYLGQECAKNNEDQPLAAATRESRTQQKDQVVAPPAAGLGVPRQRRAMRGEAAPQILGRLRTALREMATGKGPHDLPHDKHSALRILCRENSWEDASRLAAAMVLEEPQEDWPTPVESAFCVTLVHESVSQGTRLSPGELNSVALGIAASVVVDRSLESYYYAERPVVEDALMALLLAGGRAPLPRIDDPRATRASLAEMLQRMAQLPKSDERYTWLMNLLDGAQGLCRPDRPRPGNAAIAEVIWDRLTGLGDPASARADLLSLAFRLDMVDPIVRHLANVHAARYAHHIVQFMAAVKAAEANESAWDEARRLAQSFMEQIPPKTHKPWRLVVDRLNRGRKADEAVAPTTLVLENCTRKSDGLFMLELALTPAKYSVLESVTLEIGNPSDGDGPLQSFELIEPDSVAARERIVRVDVKLSRDQSSGDAIVLPYRFSARNTNSTSHEDRGRWTVEIQDVHEHAIPVETLRQMIVRCWKGAEGNPVDGSTNSFHGRKQEHARLEQFLSGEDGRQKSAVVIGQRRIGKTSLLVETLRHYPPLPGRVCAVFCQFGGIQKSSPSEPLAQTVFNALTEIADVAGYDEALCKLLAESLGNNWERQLRKGLNPATSIATALSTFVERISRATNGRVCRMAFFADEFQDVFKYDAKEVDQVMWGLRPIVQMSRTISLVFAGSGLTRELLRSYDRAFFGSIPTVNLQPFKLPEEYNAVADTFLPPDARAFLCPDETKLRPIVERAYYLTGGHPWFLSMLGSSAAQLLEGRPISPSLLGEVANRMVSGDVEFQDGETGAAKFYGHLFDSLDAAGKLKAHAQLVLTNIARQVTSEWPWVTATQAITGPRIEAAQVTSRECLEALKKLRAEDVLENSLETGTPMYRIRIPLVADAVRQDAPNIEYDATHYQGDRP